MRILVGVLAVALWAATQPAPDFRDIGKAAGLTASFPNGGEKSKDYIIETTGSGVAFIDYDNDGYLDIFVLYHRVEVVVESPSTYSIPA